IGRSSNSLVAMLLSQQPKLSFRDMTEERPRMPGTAISQLFRDRGYRTGFVTSSDLTWADWHDFLDGRGFSDVRDVQDLDCTEPLSSWGVEDRCMFEAMSEWIDDDKTRPFFLMGWTQQTHHPYEPTPNVPFIDFFQGKKLPGDDYDLGRYLNVLRETDH